MNFKSTLRMLRSIALIQEPFYKQLQLELIDREKQKNYPDVQSFLRGIVSSIDQSEKPEFYRGLKRKAIELLDSKIPIEN